MKEELEKLKAFLLIYQSHMNYARLTASLPNQFFIHVSKIIVNDKEQELHVTIVNNLPKLRNDEKKQLDSRITLPSDLIVSAINGIRDDFRENHEISYACVSPDTKIQILQNTNFKLSISIDSNEELEEARKYNHEINIKPNRTTLMRRRENK